MSHFRNWAYLNATDVLVFPCMLLLVLLQPFCSASPCDRGFIILRIQHQDCVPKSVMTSACRGTCTSYVRPSVESPDALERFCQCCDADDISYHRVIVRCPNPNWYPGAIGTTRFRRIRLGMNLPTTCRCRPCAPIPQEIVPAESDILREGKRNNKGWNITYGYGLDENIESIPVIELFANQTVVTLVEQEHSP